MSKFKVTPLFDAHKTFVRLPMGMAMLNNYPDSALFITELVNQNAEVSQDYLQTQAFLKSYSRKVKLPIVATAMRLNGFYFGLGRLLKKALFSSSAQI